MSSISLEAAIRTCKVDTAWASRVESDRFFNPSLMVCPVWNGMDLTGRRVSPDTFMTKTAGCNSAEDRILVENDLRPQYAEYINLSTNGFTADLYGNTMPYNAQGAATKELREGRKVHGSFGQDFKATTYPGCGIYAYNEAMSQEAQANRESQALSEGFQSHARRVAAGGM